MHLWGGKGRGWGGSQSGMREAKEQGVRGGGWGVQHSRERGNFTAGLLLRQSG